MFFVTDMWRGALHIDPMRLFPTEEEAQAYAKTLADEPKIYQLFPDQPPKRIKVK